MKKQKRLSKKVYIYLGLVTMAAVSLFAKPIKRGFRALNTRLERACHKKEKANLRQGLKLYSSSVPVKKNYRSK